jgi:hypothetical protein
METLRHEARCKSAGRGPLTPAPLAECRQGRLGLPSEPARAASARRRDTRRETVIPSGLCPACRAAAGSRTASDGGLYASQRPAIPIAPLQPPAIPIAPLHTPAELRGGAPPPICGATQPLSTTIAAPVYRFSHRIASRSSASLRVTSPRSPADNVSGGGEPLKSSSVLRPPVLAVLPESIRA